MEVAQSLQEVRRSGLTFAPEAGSERLRRVINKGLTDEDIFQTVEKLFFGMEGSKTLFHDWSSRRKGRGHKRYR